MLELGKDADGAIFRVQPNSDHRIQETTGGDFLTLSRRAHSNTRSTAQFSAMGSAVIFLRHFAAGFSVPCRLAKEVRSVQSLDRAEKDVHWLGPHAHMHTRTHARTRVRSLHIRLRQLRQVSSP
jgi:hypothetical protein